MNQAYESGLGTPLAGIAVELCETCSERGRMRPGIHKVGNGYLCDPCWRGDGSPSERSATLIAHGQGEVRRRYRRRNLRKFREYQRRYRERQHLQARSLRGENSPKA